MCVLNLNVVGDLPDSAHTLHLLAAAFSLIAFFLRGKSVSILHDETHPLNFCFQHLPSDGRLNVPLAKKLFFYQKSFIPTVVSVLNAGF